MDSMRIVIQICEAGRKIRQQNKIKMRQPLKKAFVYISDVCIKHSFNEYYLKEIKEELNIKDVELLKEPKWYFDIDVKPNFKTLGKKLGKSIKLFQEFLKENKEQILSEYNQGNDFVFSAEDKEYLINSKEDLNVLFINPANGLIMESIRFENNENNFAVALLMDISLSKELELECISNDLRRLIQDIRKNMNLCLDDNIIINIFTESFDILKAIQIYSQKLMEVTLCEELIIDENKENKKGYQLSGEVLIDIETTPDITIIDNTDGVFIKITKI